MKIFEIFKREKPEPEIKPVFDDFLDNWKQERFDKNVKDGIMSLNQGREILIYEDGRGFELALAIKQGYILERQKALAEKIKIQPHGSTIRLKIE